MKITSEERERKQKIIRQSWELSVPPGTFVFGVAARLEAEKRHLFLIDVVQKISELAPDYRFAVICFGRGALESRLIEKTKALGFSEKIFWKGYRSGLGDEFAGFDALLSLSSAEGLPINLIEAGWAATPVFANRVDGVADLIPSENLGALAAPDEDAKAVAEKIIRFAGSDRGLREKGIAFQEFVELHFSQEIWLRRLLEIYSQLKLEIKSGVHS